MLNKLLKQADTIAIGGHVRPDGDCIGSGMGLCQYIKDNYKDKEVDVYLEEIPEKYRFLKGTENVRNVIPAEKIYDLFICLDCADLERLGFSAPLFESAKNTLCIDHHVTNPGYAQENIIWPQASSTCEVLYGQLDEGLINQDIAACLYTGIIHDTGVLRFSCTSSRTMEIAGKLMATGIDFTKIIDDSYFKKTYLQSQILGRALMECIRFMDGKCIFTVVKSQDMDFYGVTPKDLDGIVDHLRTIDGVECAIFLYEIDNHMYKVSMRSNYVVDVSRIAAYFGGGGHVRAAGCTMSGSIHDVVNNLSEHIEKQLLAVNDHD